MTDTPTLYLPQIPKCQFCDLDAQYEAASTDADTIHDWVYVCENDLGAKTISDIGEGAGRLVLLAE
jgi:hypothetical protein